MTARKAWIIGIAAFLIGGAAGLAIGGYRGYVAGFTLILNEALAKDAREVAARVAVLRNLRTGKSEPAVESLEAGMDDILVGFDPAEPYPGLTTQTTGALAKAITEAREYRVAYPRQSKMRARDEMVRNLLARERSK